MALQNIGAGNSDDAFYRYKMPKMITKVEGKGNGIKTNVVNMVDIAKALARPASYTTKYFGCVLGAQSKFDEKTGVSLVNGSHETAKLAGLLENFIKKYVQCYGCGNPETEILITKTQMLQLKCAACGFISDVDMRDKLTTFILKNPPEQKKGSKDKKAMRRAEKERLKEGEVADEALKKLKKKTATTAKAGATKKKTVSDDEKSSPPGSHAGENESDEDNDDVEWQTDTSVEAARLRIQEQLSAATAEMVMLSTAEPEKPKSPIKALTKTEKLVQEIKAHSRKGSTSDIQSFVISLDGTPKEIMNALFAALFEGVEKGFFKEVKKNKSYLAASVEKEGSQSLLLEAIEGFCASTKPDLVKEVPHVLKYLYDEDVLEEEYIVKWYLQGIRGENYMGPIWKQTKPFIDWLQSAESESEEE